MHNHILDRLSAIRPLLHRAEELLPAGKTGGVLRREVTSGRLQRVSRGWYVGSEDWRAQYAEGRHLIQVAAALATHERSPIFSHVSAAALHGLPLFRMPYLPVHTTCLPGHRSKSTADITRHVADLDADEILEVGGVRLTSLTRTLIDLLRTAPPTIAIGCVDAVLRTAGRAPGQAPSLRSSAPARDLALSLRGDLLQEINLQPRARGNVQARALLSIADGRSDSVVESVSRLFLTDLGFEVRMQVPIDAPHGNKFWVDFEFMNMGVFGEVDGLVKYRDPALRKNRSAEEVVIEEKRREDWIRGVTGKRIVRWSPADLSTPNALRDRLALFGIHPPIGRRNRSTR